MKRDGRVEVGFLELGLHCDGRSLKDLRAMLSRADIDPREILAVIGHSTVVLSPLLRAEVERFLRLVRLSKRDG